MAVQKAASFLRWKAFALPVAVAALMACSATGLQAEEVQGAPAAPITCDSTEPHKGVGISVDAGTKKAEFVCGKTVPHVWPQKQDDSDVRFYFTSGDLKETSPLEELFGVESKLTVKKGPGARVVGDSTATATLSVGALPTVQHTIYFACGKTGYTESPQSLPSGDDGRRGRGTAQPGVDAEANQRRRDGEEKPVAVAALVLSGSSSGTAAAHRANSGVDAAETYVLGSSLQSTKATCLVTVTVPADPNAPTCTLAKKSMEVDITSEAKSTTFSCDSTIPSLSPETSSGNIFDESCAKPVKLAEALPTAKLEPAGSGYTFSVVELPSAPTTLCYKCSTSPEKERDGADESCTVKIKVAAGLSSLAGLTHLQPVLAAGSLLVIGSAVFF
ncbi:SAG-related sequence SRS53B [Besnoitia besnoiti]|uniref:SAG-related sequence SRS53B n=1 Tax=Besnoitia besnoiti TaxID=94643 RepID=A0A2A9M5F1_BESBE|nr:SAG-related sequence SRS53B [Besnoitia besnoiti]PFH33708.1 SAG-related sequence SRS53B [Besnoitia besnoiti]